MTVMNVHRDLIREIENSPPGPQIGAFFDFDGTLIAGFSATVFLKEQIRRGDLGPYQLVELISAITQFSLGTMGFSGLMTSAAQFMRGVKENDYIEFGQELYEQQIARKIYPESRALVQAHMASLPGVLSDRCVSAREKYRLPRTCPGTTGSIWIRAIFTVTAMTTWNYWNGWGIRNRSTRIQN
jgi:hypothetical protein